MHGSRSLGLDELMIVNPAGEAPGAGSGPAAFFLGSDGALYRVDPPGAGAPPSAAPDAPPRYFLGEDGAIYEVAP